MLKDLKAKFEENQKIKENCRAYYTVDYETNSRLFTILDFMM